MDGRHELILRHMCGHTVDGRLDSLISNFLLNTREVY